MSWRMIARLLPGGGSEISYKYYGYGMILSFKYFLVERDALVWSTDQQEVKELPDGFTKSLYDEIDKRLGRYKSGDADEESWGYKYLEKYLSLINGYFDNL